jgi:hypothetical protein
MRFVIKYCFHGVVWGGLFFSHVEELLMTGMDTGHRVNAWKLLKEKIKYIFVLLATTLLSLLWGPLNPTLLVV